MQGALLQHTDNPIPASLAALAQPSSQPLQLPAPQTLWTGQMLPPEVASSMQPHQEESANARPALSAGLALIDRYDISCAAGNEPSGYAETGPNLAPAGLTEQLAAEACKASSAHPSPWPPQLSAPQQPLLTGELPPTGEVAAKLLPPPEESAAPPEAAPLIVSAVVAPAEHGAGNEATGRATTVAAAAHDSLPEQPAVETWEAGPLMEESSVPATELELCPAPATAGQKAWGKSKSCPLLAGPLAWPKPQAAAKGEQHSCKRMRRAFSECPAEAARALQTSRSPETGSGSSVTMPAATTDPALAPPEGSAAADEGAAGRGSCQVRQPSAEAHQSVAHQPASRAEPKVCTRFYLEPSASFGALV